MSYSISEFLAKKHYFRYSFTPMSLPLKKAREIVYLILYTLDLHREGLMELEKLLRAELKISKKQYLDAFDRAIKIEENLPSIDVNIERISTAYPFDRIQTVEKNLIRLGVYEILFDADIPPKVAITEAIRLAKKFGTSASSQFVNAILDNIYKESIGQPIDSEEITLSSQVLESEESSREG